MQTDPSTGSCLTTDDSEMATDKMDDAIDSCTPPPPLDDGSQPPPSPPPPSSPLSSKSCPAGQESSTSSSGDGDGSTSTCLNCAANQYKRRAGSSRCDVCPQGSGLPGGASGDHTDCQPCGADLVSKDGVECKPCPSGQEPNSDHSACETANVNRDANAQSTGAKAVVTAFATSANGGLKGYDTYRVALKVTSQDALNLDSIYGSDDDKYHMQIPAAKQVNSSSVMQVGGVNPSEFQAYPDAKYGKPSLLQPVSAPSWVDAVKITRGECWCGVVCCCRLMAHC